MLSRRMRGLKHSPPRQFFIYNSTYDDYEGGEGYATERHAVERCNSLNRRHCYGRHVVHTVTDVISGKYAGLTYNRLWIMAEIGARKDYPKHPPMDPERERLLVDWMFPFRLAYYPHQVTAQPDPT